jgi:O-acetyl-ADP-ribose deacetylase (regulator of RNase III)
MSPEQRPDTGATDAGRPATSRPVRIEAVRGDITAQQVDVVVNAANASLLGGGGVDGALHSAAGPQLLEACRGIRRTQWPEGLPTGRAVLTPGFDLPAPWVVHTVGPQHWEHEGGGAHLLADCHVHALELADTAGAREVAFPAISCGVYGWSAVDAAPIAVGAVRRYLRDHDSGVTLVRFVLFNDEAYAAFAAACAA